MAEVNSNRVLKVGLVQDGKLIEELTLKPRTAVTIGQDPECMFVINEASFPKRHTLLKSEQGVYTICALEGMQGKISLDDRVVTIDDVLKGEGGAKKGKISTLKLTNTTKGKVIIGNTTILFQMVAPGMQIAPMKLPAELRGGLLRDVDIHFLVVLLISLLIHMGMIKYMNSVEIPEREAYEPPPIVADFVMPDLPEPEPVPEDEDLKEEEGEGEKTATKSSKPKAGPKGPEEKGFLALITKQSNKSGAVADLLSDGLGEDITDALSNLGGVKVARNGTVGTRQIGGGGGPGSVGIDGLGNMSKGGTLDTKKKNLKRVSTVRTEKGQVDGKLDQALIAATVRKYLNGIKACYEYQLKSDPNLKGKVTVRFTIGTEGKVISAKVTSSTLQHESVKRCIIRRIKRWKFPKPEDGTVTVSYPFVFTAVSR